MYKKLTISFSCYYHYTLNLVGSPNSPLRQAAEERAASIHAIIYIMNQLFLANNDLIDLDWIENESCQTGRRKWDGVILRASDKKYCEFSGGTKANTTMNKGTSASCMITTRP
ncbi:hypothetical protein RMATCC62417_01008 [Rhizopus microsporus]|nr:hypothetical protein RMATCC62417_01008 [Rhizopus microsporus]